MMRKWNWNPSMTAVICQSLELTKQWRNADAENEMDIDIKCDQIDKCNAISEGHFVKWHRNHLTVDTDHFQNTLFDRTQDCRQSPE
jgi:hypothetical protein